MCCRRRTLRSLRRRETFRKSLLEECPAIIGTRFGPRFLCQLPVAVLRRRVPVGVNTRWMKPIGSYYFHVVLLFVSPALSFLAEILCQLTMLFRRIGGVDQVGRLLPSQMLCWEWCRWVRLGNLCRARPKQRDHYQGSEYCGFHMSSFHGHRFANFGAPSGAAIMIPHASALVAVCV